MAQDQPLVVVGAGVAGIRFVRRLRRSGHEGPVVLVDAQPGDPYDRPPLSKVVLRGERELPVSLDAAGLAALDVDYRPGHRAVALRPDRSSLVLDNGELAYSTLVIATGARARRLPGLDGRVLRTFEDAVGLRAHARPGQTAVVVGAGVVGCEVAASLRGLGADVHLVDPLAAPMLRVMGPVLAPLAADLHEKNGVVLHLGAVVTASEGGRVTLSDGTELAPDLVLEAVGTEPDLDWLDGSGLELGDGVLCDAEQRTNVPGVYVVGDVAAPGGRRSEHWTAATRHADLAVASILGTRPPADEPAYWWSDQYDVKLQGLGEVADADEVVVGTSGEGRLGLLGRQGRLVGAVGLDAAGPLMRLRRGILAGESLVVASSGVTDATWHAGDGSEDLPDHVPDPARRFREALLSSVAGGAR